MNLDYLKKQNLIIKKKLLNSLSKSIISSDFILGNSVSRVEKKLANYVGSKFCSTVSSGTDALFIALKCLNIKKGDEVITSPFSWISAAEMIATLGARPVFCDIDPLTFNIDPDEIIKNITPKTKAIIPISLFGQICDIKSINKIANKYNLKVIEDAAQSFGSYVDNINSCNCTNLSITSFFPTKPLGTLGDGGAIFTNNKNYFKFISMFKNHGQQVKGKYNLIGTNARFDTIKASFLLEKLRIFKKEVLQRQRVYKNYCNLFQKYNINAQLPFIKLKTLSVFAQFPVLVSRKNRVKIEQFNKKSNNLKFPIFYNEPIYNLKPYKKFYKKKLPVTEIICKTIFCIPFHPYMNKKEQDNIIRKLNTILTK